MLRFDDKRLLVISIAQLHLVYRKRQVEGEGGRRGRTGGSFSPKTDCRTCGSRWHITNLISLVLQYWRRGYVLEGDWCCHGLDLFGERSHRQHLDLHSYATPNHRRYAVSSASCDLVCNILLRDILLFPFFSSPPPPPFFFLLNLNDKHTSISALASSHDAVYVLMRSFSPKSCSWYVS